MTIDYYFPLFQEIMLGSMNPLLPENAEGPSWKLKVDELIFMNIPDPGVYLMEVGRPHSLKTTWYYRKIVSETYLYTEDLLQLLVGESNRKIRTWYRDQILDKHLTSCLILVGEKLKALESLKRDDFDTQSNVYIFQLLKTCIAKAYLEIQYALRDVVAHPLTEEWLYKSLVVEPAPICRISKKSIIPPAPSAATTTQAATKAANNPTERTYNSLQVRELLGLSESTLNRKKKAPGFPLSVKVGREDYYKADEVDAWHLAHPRKGRQK